MGKTSGSFKKGEGGNRKGIKNKATQIKEVIGLDSWDSLYNYMVNKGPEKFIQEISTLKGSAYLINYLQMLEYFKPKLSRIDSNVNIQADIKSFIVELTNEANSQTNEGI
jgi:hypothetical protein